MIHMGFHFAEVAKQTSLLAVSIQAHKIEGFRAVNEALKLQLHA
jgi:hypothetical protein